MPGRHRVGLNEVQAAAAALATTIAAVDAVWKRANEDDRVVHIARQVGQRLAPPSKEEMATALGREWEAFEVFLNTLDAVPEHAEAVAVWREDLKLLRTKLPLAFAQPDTRARKSLRGLRRQTKRMAKSAMQHAQPSADGAGHVQGQKRRLSLPHVRRRETPELD